MKSFKDPETGLWLPKRDSILIPNRVVYFNAGGMGIGLRRNSSGGGGGGSPAIVNKAAANLDAASGGYSIPNTRSLSIPATGTNTMGVAAVTEANANPGVTCNAGGNAVTAQGALGGLNVFTVVLTSSISSISFTGGTPWSDWAACWIEFSVVTSAESWGTAQTYYTNSHTTSAGTPTHANAVVVSVVNAGYTGAPGTVALTSGAPWSLENDALAGTSVETLMAVHLTPSNGTPYTSSWSQTGSQGWNSVTGVLY